MAVVQVAASLTVLAHPLAPAAASAFGLVTAWAAGGLAASARLVEWLPWLALRMPAPAAWVSATYLLALAGLVAGPYLPALPRSSSPGGQAGQCRGRWQSARSGSLSAPSTWRWPWRIDGLLRVVALDVGQGDATLVEFPNGARWLVDAGGLPGSVAFDIGERVVAPSLWARGTGRLDALVLTHGDPDHIGGAAAVIADFAPSILDGIPVPSHVPLQRLQDLARARHRRVGATPPRAALGDRRRRAACVAPATAGLGAPARAQRRLDRDRVAIRGGVDRAAGGHQRAGRTLAGRRDPAGPLIGSSRPPTTAARHPRATSGSTHCAPMPSCSAAGVRTATGIPRRRSWIESANEARRCSGRMKTGRWWWRRMGRRSDVSTSRGARIPDNHEGTKGTRRHEGLERTYGDSACGAGSRR